MEIIDRALILDRREWSDRHLLIEVLCASAGTLKAVVRGARSRRGGEKAAATQVLSEVSIRLYKRPSAELWTLREIGLETSSFPLASSLLRAGAAAAVAETLSTFNLPGEDSSKAFRLGRAALSSLLGVGHPPTVLAYVQAWTLQLAGLMPDPRSCCECGCEILDAVLLGELLMPRCSEHAAADATRIEAAELDFLVAAANRPPDQLDQRVGDSLARWLSALIRHHAERRQPALTAFERERLEQRDLSP